MKGATSVLLGVKGLSTFILVNVTHRFIQRTASGLPVHAAVLMGVLRYCGPDGRFHGAHGPHGDGRALRVVPTEPGHHRPVLVWHPVQGHVPALGAALLQPRHCWRVRELMMKFIPTCYNLVEVKTF